jgi:D-glycero-D-manno-heptose 1,7-bisphosphate phosphatase
LTRPAVFLDRDGTLNRERGHVVDPAQLEVIPGAADAVQRLHAAGWPLVVVTNQSSIALGLLDEATLARVHAKLHAALGSLPWAYFHCPHHPDADPGGGYGGPCTCRKPQDGLLHQAAAVLGVSLAGSVVVGDSARDLLMARAHPMRRILVRSGKPWRDELAKLVAAGCPPDAVADDLAAAARLVTQGSMPQR